LPDIIGLGEIMVQFNAVTSGLYAMSYISRSMQLEPRPM
jgi:hypothetical protein